MIEPTFLWRIETEVPAVARPVVEDFLEQRCVAVMAFEIADGVAWRVEGFTGAEPDGSALARDLAGALAAAGMAPPARLGCEQVAPRDWLADNLASFPPLEIGRYFIHGSHFEARPPAGKLAIRLDPGTAFGSGEHATTAACLEAIDGLARRRQARRPLDMGCGSGILAVAMAKTWRVPVVASDLDPEAARVTAVNARRNGVGGWVRARCGRGFELPAVRRDGPYDLICANILARPLIAMAGALTRNLRPAADGGGTAVLPGLLERDGNWVAQAYRSHGLRLSRRIVRDGWTTLVMERRPAAL